MDWMEPGWYVPGGLAIPRRVVVGSSKITDVTESWSLRITASSMSEVTLVMNAIAKGVPNDHPSTVVGPERFKAWLRPSTSRPRYDPSVLRNSVRSSDVPLLKTAVSLVL